MSPDEISGGGDFDRRTLLKGAALAGLASTAGPIAAANAETRRSRGAIARENRRQGTTDWQLTYTKVDPGTRYRCPWIEGYASHASVKQGESIDVMVSTNPPARFAIDFFRMGYYGGTGARHMLAVGPLQGVTQPDPAVGPERLRECEWIPSASIRIPEDWISGVYLGKLSLVDTPPDARCESYVVFIVRDDRPADIVFQCSDNTWQAYNRWPSQFSLYDDGESEWALKAGVRVGYGRPYGKYCQVVDAPLSQGSGEFLLWEFPMAYWLEREGYDVTYISNTDVHKDAACIARAKAMLSVGHDEYWSLEQFRNVKAAVAAGVNVGFFSGNTCCFVAPLEPDGRGRAARTFTRAGRYGGLLETERERMGPFPIEGPNEATLIGARTISPFNGAGDWIVADPAQWMFDGTGLRKGEGIPGLVGWEFHGDPARIDGLAIVAEGIAANGAGESAHWTSTLYPGPKNNWVFNASTIYWAQGLSNPPGHVLPYAHYGRPHGPDERVERITRNILDRFTA